MSPRTLEDYGRAAVALPGYRRSLGMRVVAPEAPPKRLCWHMESEIFGGPGDGDSRVRPRNGAALVWAVPDVDDPATAGALELLLGADLVTWDRREDTRGIEVTWPDGDHVYIHCETKGRGLVLAAEYRGRWDGGGA